MNFTKQFELCTRTDELLKTNKKQTKTNKNKKIGLLTFKTFIIMETIKIDVKPHRYYNFRHDLDIDWRGIYHEEDEALKDYRKLEKKYYTYELDFFDHSAISFSLVIDRQNIGYYEFDRSRNVGLIAIPRSLAKNGFEAQEIARDYLEDYNMEINGRDED